MRVIPGSGLQQLKMQAVAQELQLVERQLLDRRDEIGMLLQKKKMLEERRFMLNRLKWQKDQLTEQQQELWEWHNWWAANVAVEV